jgi:hypothetical protein
VSEPSPRPAADVVARRLGDSAVLVRLSTNRIYELNDTGARLWELLEQGTTPDLAVTTLAEEFDAPRDEIARDVDALIRDLTAQGLLVS